ncbi:A/G-specific adenine glycosylase [Neokomagataea anthophila]|uniref:Adenine DNA glycosylase n=1 Tax=Neokomagataea anthophila TaxID=2826925 RepID=A0ABS5E4T5_9PROT|nr:A/G-specific adenine glycosylase [Neokomagataea anthophila]
MILNASELLRWYDTHRRSLPWRGSDKLRPSPYAVWLSEIMLQQTTVQAVIPYFERFFTDYPTVQALAAAPLEDVLQRWAGLGYYARARNLHACAQKVTERGGFPQTVDELQTLPGIGAYTARAVAAIAFGVPVVPVDGNVERVTSRLFAVEDPIPGARPQLHRHAATLNDDPIAKTRPSDFAQALFDLGSSICTPRNPTCLPCPWRTPCKAQAQGIAASLPKRAPKAVRPTRYGAHFIITDHQGQFLLRQRPAKGLLGGMDEFPGTEWRSSPWSEEEALNQAPALLSWTLCGEVTHIFSHFTLKVTVYGTRLLQNRNQTIDTDYGSFRPLKSAALPGIMSKCLALYKTSAQ